jgi:hypothetical protein
MMRVELSEADARRLRVLSSITGETVQSLAGRAIRELLEREERR